MNARKNSTKTICQKGMSSLQRHRDARAGQRSLSIPQGRHFRLRGKACGVDPEKIDGVECPDCKGAGTTGLVSDVCRYCGGSHFVTRGKKNKYKRDEIDEV